MSPTSKDLVVCIVAGITIMIVFASFELVEMLCDVRREYEDFYIGEIIGSMPALAIVAVWFAVRRWREVGKLEDGLKQRRAMEKQLREVYKVAAMGTLGGGFAGELTKALEPIEATAREGIEQAGAGTEDRSRFEKTAQATKSAAGIVSRMLAFGDGGMREREVVVAAGAIRQSIAQAREEVDSTLDIEYRIDDASSRIGINRWEVSEVMGQLVANAIDAMGAGGRIRVSIEDTEIGEDEARLQGVYVGAHVRVRVEDEGPGIAVALRSHVFEPFFTTKGAGDGKGLGLAIAYSLVRGWNGNLSVGSRGNRGASFEILIPAA